MLPAMDITSYRTQIIHVSCRVPTDHDRCVETGTISGSNMITASNLDRLVSLLYHASNSLPRPKFEYVGDREVATDGEVDDECVCTFF